MDCSPAGSSLHEDSPGKNTGVGCHALLQGIFPTQGSNQGLPHLRQIFTRPLVKIFTILSLHEHISLYLFLITVANQYDIPYVLTLSSLSLSHLFFDFRSHFYLLKWWTSAWVYFIGCVHVCAQSYPTLCDPMDCSLPGSSVCGNFPAKRLEWVAVSSSRRSSWPRYWTCIACVSCIGRWIIYQ